MKKITIKKTHKTAVILLIIASLLFGCCACSKDTNNPNTSKSEVAILAKQVKVGDYVNYNAASRNGAGKNYTADGSLTGSSTTSTFHSSDEMKWIVMSVDKDSGTVELRAENPTAEKLELCGKPGYKNAEKVLNDIAAIYGCGDGATGGRSITIEDVNILENYTPEDITASYTYTEGTFINADGTEVTATEDNPVTMSNAEEKITDRWYHYRPEKMSFSKTTFWLASRSVEINWLWSEFMVRYVENGVGYDNGVGGDRLFSSYGATDSGDRGVMPVVTLKANIKTSGQDENGAWNLIIE